MAISQQTIKAAVASQTPPVENLDVRETAAWLRVSERTAAGLVASGELPHFRVGRQIRINFDQLREWAREKGQAMTTNEDLILDPLRFLDAQEKPIFQTLCKRSMNEDGLSRAETKMFCGFLERLWRFYQLQLSE